MDLGSCPLCDVLDIAAIAALHEEMVLGCNVQVSGNWDGACQATSQVFQQQSGTSLEKQGWQNKGIKDDIVFIMYVSHLNVLACKHQIHIAAKDNG